MAVSVTVAEKAWGSVKKITWTWTTAADGTVTGGAGITTTNSYDGQVAYLVTDPGATAPTDDYDITVTNDAGHDVLAGAGANRDTANTEYVVASSLGYVAGSKLTLNVANAGDTKDGVTVLYIR